MRGRRWTLAAAGACATALVLSACARSPLPQDSLSPAGPYARKIDRLFDPVFWIAVGVFVLVEGLLVVALIRFRHRPGAPVPRQVHGNPRLEIAWTLAPSLLLAGVAAFTIPVIFQLAARPTGNVLDIHVTGHQWWWEVRYPGLGVVTANELHIPVGRPVYLTLTSGPSGSAGEPVIHSFWVPRLAGKQDLEPGHVTHLTIEADRPGTYLGQCAEYCGLSHANMRLRVIAETAQGFQAWVNAQRQRAAPPSPEVTQILQKAGCGGCHTIEGVPFMVGEVGPNLTHFADREYFAGDTFPNTAANLAAWIHDAPAMKPGADMPVFAGQLSPEEIQTLVAYLRSLK